MIAPDYFRGFPITDIKSINILIEKQYLVYLLFCFTLLLYNYIIFRLLTRKCMFK